MVIISSGHPDFKDYWTRFVSTNPGASWRYLWSRMEYQKAFMGESIEKDLSFILLDGPEPILACPLFLERRRSASYFSSGGGYLEAPLMKDGLPDKKAKQAERECFPYIDRLACEHHVRSAKFMIDPLGKQARYNPLTKYGYFDSSVVTVIVDLKQDEGRLWADLRKSYKALINRALKKYRVVFVDASNPDEEVFRQYVLTHCKAAGRTTRPARTFEIQMEKIRNDEATLIGVVNDERLVAFSYFSHFNGGVYYGSMADDPDCDSDMPFEHCMLWRAIEYYKRRGFKRLETGVQQFGIQVFDLPVQKNINISFFKRGFGGSMTPVYRGIKFYDKGALESSLMRFMNEYQCPTQRVP